VGDEGNGRREGNSGLISCNGDSDLGWEFQFLVPISGTLIVCGIPIMCSISKIPVGFFFEIPLSGESENWNSDLGYLESR
jgi:hypothetical protein